MAISRESSAPILVSAWDTCLHQIRHDGREMARTSTWCRKLCTKTTRIGILHLGIKNGPLAVQIFSNLKISYRANADDATQGSSLLPGPTSELYMTFSPVGLTTSVPNATGDMEEKRVYCLMLSKGASTI